MSTTLTNNYINKFDEKLKIYNNIFFKVFKSNNSDNSYSLLNELNNINYQPNTLNIPSDSSSTYSVDQFNNFIRNIINFKIKNNDDLKDKNNNMDFLNRVVADNGTVSYNYNANIKTNIIETLKVINVFVDILEAYKFCIDKETDTTSPSGYTKDIEIERIELVSDTTRFYTSANTGMYPGADIKNAGYIRPIKEVQLIFFAPSLLVQIVEYCKKSFGKIKLLVGTINFKGSAYSHVEYSPVAFCINSSSLIASIVVKIPKSTILFFKSNSIKKSAL
jgi:hypothetical protein